MRRRHAILPFVIGSMARIVTACPPPPTDDTTPPVLSLPADITVVSAAATGAPVTFSARPPTPGHASSSLRLSDLTVVE